MSMENDKKLFLQHKELIEQIRREESLQPSERNNEGFYTTKNIFREHGGSLGIDIFLEHKQWRGRGMHKYMKSALLKMFNHLNQAECTHIDRSIESGAHIPGTKYPDINWEDLECHAAIMKVQELQRINENNQGEASQNKGMAPNQEQENYEYLNVDELVELRCRQDTGSNKKTTRETLLRHCNNMRAKYARGEVKIPCRLYSNSSDLSDIEIEEIPLKGTNYKFRKRKVKT
jgi:hypothetical protein